MDRVLMFRRTLLLRLSSTCSGCGAKCRYVVNECSTLKPESVAKLFDHLDLVDECVVLCSSPTRNNRVLDIMKLVSSACRRVRLMVPIADVLSISMTLVNLVDEISVVVSPSLNADYVVSTLKRLLESVGLEKLVMYVVLEDVSNLGEAARLVKEAHALGLHVRIGERPYCSSRHVDLRLELIRRGVRVGLPSIYVYGYRGSLAEIGGVPTTVLFKDPTSCNVLYLDADNTLSKCPTAKEMGFFLSASEIGENLHRIASFRCREVRKAVPVLRLAMKVGDVEIPPEVLHVLELIKHFNSLRRACTALGLSPSRCLEKLRKVESRLRTKLVVAKHGGREGGATYLTTAGIDIVEVYERVKESVARALISMGEDDFVLY